MLAILIHRKRQSTNLVINKSPIIGSEYFISYEIHTQNIYPTLFRDPSLYFVVEQLEHILYIQLFFDGKCSTLDQKSIVMGRLYDSLSV